MIKVSFYPDGTYKASSKLSLCRYTYRFRRFCNECGYRYKRFCDSSNLAFRSTELSMIQWEWWVLCNTLKDDGVIKDSSQFKMEFVEPEQSPYRVLGGLDEESCM